MYNNSIYEFDKNNQLVSYEAPAERIYTASFVTNKGWNEVYAYAYTDGADGGQTTEFLGPWPGTKLEAVNGIYPVMIKAETAPAKIIFNNNAGEQTENLDFENGKTYVFNNPITIAEAVKLIDDAQGKTIEGVSIQGIISKIDSYNSQYGSITYWISADGSTEGQQFEVYSGLNIGGEKFKSKDDIEVGAKVVVTGSIKLYNNSIYEFDKNNQLVSYEAPQPVLNTYTASFEDKGNWAEVWAYTYSMNEAGEVIAKELGEWPGTKLQPGADNLYQVIVKAENAPQFIVFNNGVEGEGKLQTEDFAFENGKTYTNAEPTPVMNTYTATFTTDRGWDEVYAYAYTETPGEGGAPGTVKEYIGQWPGVQLEKGADNVYRLSFDATEAPAFIVFNNGLAGEAEQKTPNWEFVDKKAYEYNKPVVNEYTVQFVNNRGWQQGSVRAYAWNANGQVLGDWPGTEMGLIDTEVTYGGEKYPVYELKFKAETAPEFIIFNDGTPGEQDPKIDVNKTEDLVFEDGKQYLVLPMKGELACNMKEAMQLDYSDKVKIYNGMPKIIDGVPSETETVKFKVGDALHIRIVNCPGMRSPGLQLMSDDGKTPITENLAAGIKEVPAIITIPITGAVYEWMKDADHRVRLNGTNVFIDRMTVEADVYPAAETPAEEETTVSVWVPENVEGEQIAQEEKVEIPATPFVVVDVKKEEIVKIKASSVEPNSIIAKRRALAATDISIMKKGSSDVKLVADDQIRVSEDGSGYEFTVSDGATVTELKTNGFDIKNNTEKPIKIKAIEVQQVIEPAKYYLVGTMTDWAVSEDYELTPDNDNAGQYKITKDFAANDEFKIVMSTDESIISTWYPEGIDNNYKITEAGNYTIYFRPDGQGAAEWYYGFFYVHLNEATGINGVKNAAALKDAQIFTISGQRVERAHKGLYIVNGKKVVVK